MKRYIFPIVVLAALVFAGRVLGMSAGEKAPEFNVTSGDGQALSLNDLSGKKAVIIYETRETIETNRPLKDELWTMGQGSFRVVPVINCSQASSFTKGIWKSNLRKNSEKEKITIYGDWDGGMAEAYQMKEKDSNVVVLDKGGVARYFFKGRLSETDMTSVKKYLTSDKK